MATRTTAMSYDMARCVGPNPQALGCPATSPYRKRRVQPAYGQLIYGVPVSHMRPDGHIEPHTCRGRTGSPQRTSPGGFGKMLTIVLAVSGILAGTAQAGTVVLETRINASSDDAVQMGSTVDLTTANLALGQWTVGLRFTGVTIPPASPITNAYVEFIAAAADPQNTDLLIVGEASDDAATFVALDNDLSSRPTTTASVAWDTVAPWVLGEPQASPDISDVLQEIVDRPGWSSGNALALVITGTGRRRAVAHDGNPGTAALLHVEYQAPGVTIVETAGATDVSETGPTSDTYTIVLDTQPAATVNIAVDPDDQTDLGAGPGSAITLTFDDLDWDQPQTVTVTAVDDAVVEGAHTSTITHAATSADPHYDALAVADVVAAVADNDVAAVLVTESGGSTDVDEQGPTADSYTIVLGSAPAAYVDIVVNPDEQSDVGAGPGVPILITFGPGTWNTARAVTVTADDDSVVEGPHTSTITHSVFSGDPLYNGISVADVIANITDNDTPDVIITETLGSTAVSETGPTSDTYSLELNSQPTADVIVTADPDDQTDLGNGMGVAVVITIAAAHWDQPH
jgi:hypothetical protein